jgi:PKD repeat protein
MQRILYFGAIGLLCSIFSIAHAQDPHFSCGHTKVTNDLWNENPALREDYKNLLLNGMNLENTNGVMKSTFIIPIVFHIVHEYGTENISDAQVYDQVEILNEDFRKLNVDIAQVIPEFQGIAADCNIEFRLATKDPAGNCTNGIDHIYSHETNIGDDYSKLNQWHRSKYLNVWVVKSMRDGVAGYAYYPTDVDGDRFFRDGIIILHNYIGSIGTGNPNLSRALTHEIGHYLGLAHPWGSTNQPGVACGDDGVPDTPLTRGWSTCPSPNQARVCNDSVVENYQNFMDYSYCSKMFTEKQGEFMRNVLLQLSGNRDNLWKEENLAVTGADVLTMPLCKPVADIRVGNRSACVGDNVSFTDVSWNAQVSSRTWYFEDGIPATSSDDNPTVQFTSYGYKKVKLVVSNATGSDSVLLERAVFISDLSEEIYGPDTENFDSGDLANWIVENPGDGFSRWQLSQENGVSNSRGFELKNYRNITQAQLFTNTYFYYDRLGGTKDGLITPSYNLAYSSNVSVSFDYAYATNATTGADITERLRVFVSRNCGRTWQLLETISGTDLVTNGNAGYSDFMPDANTTWRNISIPLLVSMNDTKTRFKIEFEASDFSNNLYIDNFNVSGVLSVEESPLASMEMLVYPNPADKNDLVYVSYQSNNEPMDFQVLDANGRILTSGKWSETNQALVKSIDFSAWNAGVYFLSLSQQGFTRLERIVRY